MLYRKIPFLRLIIPLIGGILLSEKITIPASLTISLISASSGLIIYSFFVGRRERHSLYGIGQTILLFVLGSLLCTMEKKSISTLPGGTINLTVRVNDYPVLASERYKFEATMITASTPFAMGKVKGGIIIYADTNSVDMIEPGNLITMSIRPSRITNHNNPAGFNYERYMRIAGIAYTGFLATENIIEVSRPSRLTISERALILRNGLIRKITPVMDRRSLGIVSALFLGRRELLVSDQAEAFATAGAMHIMAVSGLHAGIISMVVFSLLFFLKGRLHILRIVLTIAALWGFAYLTGLSPSVRRASIMFTLFHAGGLLKRPADSVNTLLGTAFIILLLEPGQIFSTGFQMSYLAVLSIVLFFKRASLLFAPKNRIVLYLWQLTVVSLLAQGATMAVSIAAFNRFPSLFLITNIAVIPLAFILITTTLLTFVLSPVSALFNLFAHLSSYIAAALDRVTQYVASVPFATIEDIGLTPLRVLFVTVFFFIIIDLILNRKERSSLPILLFLLLSLSVDLGLVRRETIGNELIAYHSMTAPDIAIRSGRILYHLTPSDTTGRDVKKHANTNRLKLVEYPMKDELNVVEIDGTRIMIVYDHFTLPEEPEWIDYFFYLGKSRLDPGSFPQTGWLIIARRSLLPSSFVPGDSLRIHSVREEGCFRHKI